MVSDTDKKELEEHFSKQYVLIPKNRVYHVAGGILGVLVLGLGISYQAVLKVVDSQMANEARQNIMAVEKNVTAAQQRIAEIESGSKRVMDSLLGAALQEREAAKKRIAEVEQVGKEAAEKLSIATVESLKAKRIAIVDKDGNERIRLMGMDADGLPCLSLYDSNNKERLELTENLNGHAGLWLRDHNGKWRMMLTTDHKDGQPAIYTDNISSFIRNYSENNSISPPFR